MRTAGSSDRYRLVESVYQRAADVPREHRAAFLQTACGGDDQLRAEVESLLSHLEAAPARYLETPVHDLAACVDAGPLPQRIGGYSVVGLLGRGGMGTVYEAEQARPRRRVALKMIRRDALSDDALRRFRHEADALGQLRHPGIAQIYEFGVGDVWFGDVATHQQLFFAMELVAGVSLADYAARHRLDRPTLLELIARVCDAVHHAHQKGVIHRDLKPSNIVVDERGQPKVLDFGVARMTRTNDQTLTNHTSPGALLGTLPYMSPEQFSGAGHAADTRSDVYALGVMAYEVLTGRLPFDVAGLPPAAAIKVLAETDARRAGLVRPDLRGDVESILAKTLERDPARRYASAAEMAADLRRHLRCEPISARPATALYQLRKFARRNRLLVGAGALLFATLVGSTAWIASAMFQERRATARALALGDFLRDILASADPATGRADVRLVEVLRAAADDAARRFADSPEFEADVRTVLARAFSNLSLDDEALTHARRAYELRRTTLGDADPQTRAAGVHLADVLKRVQRIDDARQIAEAVLAATPPGEQDSAAGLSARRTLAVIRALRGDVDAAEREFRDVLGRARAHLGERHPITLASISDLAWFLQCRAVRGLSADRLRDATEAAALQTSALPAHIAAHGESGYATLNLCANLAQTLLLSGQFAEAGEHAVRVLEMAGPRFGEDHAFCQRARTALVEIRFAQGRYGDAAAGAVANVASIQRRTGGADSILALSEMSDVLHVLDAGDRLAEAEEYARTLYARFGGELAHDADMPLRYRIYLARFLSRQGKLDEADEHFGEILAREAELKDEHFFPRIDLAYGGHLAARGDFAGAEARLLSAYDRFKAAGEWRVPLHQELIRLYDAWARPADADAWRQRLAGLVPESARTPS